MEVKNRIALGVAAAVVVIGLVFLGVKFFYQAPEPEIPEKRISVTEKKQRFLQQVAPVVSRVHQELLKRYQKIKLDLENGRNADGIAALKQEYKVTTDKELLRALKPHPPSIALAQAAMESAWGTSRFFREANNIFGVWSFSKDEPRIAAGEKRGDKTIWVRKYASLEGSVRDYYRTLGRSAAFEEFRQLKMQTSDPYQLVKKLDRYSEKKHEYGRELASMIRFNRFEEYDDGI